MTAVTLVWILAATVATSGKSAREPGGPAASGSALSTAPPAGQAGSYVGDDTCMTCHESEGKSLRPTLHGKAQNERTPAGSGRSCESCHGPGKAHVDSGDAAKIRRFNAVSAREANDTCLSCHEKGAHANWTGSMHDARNVSCVSCHSVHAAKSEKTLLKASTTIETCASCHKTEALKARKSGHMPVREGKMECTSCHTPHGSNNVRMLKVVNWINESCASCHTEKRGPFLWEHAAGRENCVSCHDPHGSNNDRMLVAKAPMLCQRCHVSSRHPATVYDAVQVGNASNRIVGRACVNCHSQIHGSNHPAGHTFLR
jgi:DmsE family decaheme c-type cytochrome